MYAKCAELLALIAQALACYIGPGGQAWVHQFVPPDERLLVFMHKSLAGAVGTAASTAPYKIEKMLFDKFGTSEPQWFLGMVRVLKGFSLAEILVLGA